MLIEFLASSGESVIWIENIFLAIFTLLCLVGVRVCVFYKFQLRAMEMAASEIRNAACGKLFGRKEYEAVGTVGQGGYLSDLRMIFDLTRWRFSDFYPDLKGEEDA